MSSAAPHGEGQLQRIQPADPKAERLPATRDVVLANRRAPPDKILQEVYRRTGDKPFKNIDDVISREEIAALSESYKRIAGYDKARLQMSLPR